MPQHFSEFLIQQHSPGVFILSQHLPISQVVEELLTVWEASEAEEWVDTIQALPLGCFGGREYGRLFNRRNGELALFKNFCGQELLNGRAIFVRFVISWSIPNSCRFEQAFSDDGGKTWEVNWVAIDTRAKDEFDKALKQYGGNIHLFIKSWRNYAGIMTRRSQSLRLAPDAFTHPSLPHTRSRGI
jgi:hypothetical protein